MGFVLVILMSIVCWLVVNRFVIWFGLFGNWLNLRVSCCVCLW